MKFKIVFILSCVCVHFSTSSEVVEDVDKIESKRLLELMYGALTPETKNHQNMIEVFREKYSQSQIELSYVPKENGNFLISNKKLSVDFGLAEQFLKAFSESIKKLSIAYHLLPDDSHKQIGRLVNVHCSETLEEFHAKNCKNGAFDEMEKPFKKVTNVSFDGDWWDHAENQLGLDKLFPEMRVLNFTYTGGYIYDRHYPNLIEVNTFETTAYDFGKLIAKNPQIKQLRVEETTMGFLKYVSEKLPDLETLAFVVPIDSPHYQESEIQFERVTELSVTDFHHHFRSGKFSFKNLKHFELLVDGNIKDEWISFIGNNKNLESLTVTAGYLNEVTFLILSKKFNGLLEAKINLDMARTVGVESVVEFIENNKQMKKITVNFARGSVAYFKELSKLLDKQWKITPLDKDYSILSASKLEPYIQPVEDAKIKTEDIKLIIPVDDEKTANKITAVVDLDDKKQTSEDTKNTVDTSKDVLVNDEPTGNTQNNEEKSDIKEESTTNKDVITEAKEETHENAEAENSEASNVENTEAAGNAESAEGDQKVDGEYSGAVITKTSIVSVLAVTTIVVSLYNLITG